LIPKIPGVTELLNAASFPLPILQIPTPALPTPVYSPSNIRPKKIGYYVSLMIHVFRAER
jgi:selenium-binding protein 1